MNPSPASVNINGDGRADLLIGAETANAAYVVFDPPDQVQFPGDPSALQQCSILARGLLRWRAAELEWLVTHFATACDESDNSTKQRHNCDLIRVHGSTPFDTLPEDATIRIEKTITPVATPELRRRRLRRPRQRGRR